MLRNHGVLQVYALEKVLKIKKDTSTHVVFLDEAMKVSQSETFPSSTCTQVAFPGLRKHTECLVLDVTQSITAEIFFRFFKR